MRLLIIGLTALTLAACGQPADSGGGGSGRISPVTMFNASPILAPPRKGSPTAHREAETAKAHRG